MSLMLHFRYLHHHWINDPLNFWKGGLSNIKYKHLFRKQYWLRAVHNFFKELVSKFTRNKLIGGVEYKINIFAGYYSPILTYLKVRDCIFSVRSSYTYYRLDVDHGTTLLFHIFSKRLNLNLRQSMKPLLHRHQIISPKFISNILMWHLRPNKKSSLKEK